MRVKDFNTSERTTIRNQTHPSRPPFINRWKSTYLVLESLFFFHHQGQIDFRYQHMAAAASLSYSQGLLLVSKQTMKRPRKPFHVCSAHRVYSVISRGLTAHSWSRWLRLYSGMESKYRSDMFKSLDWQRMSHVTDSALCRSQEDKKSRLLHLHMVILKHKSGLIYSGKWSKM